MGSLRSHASPPRAAALLAVVVLAACGGDDGGGGTSAATATAPAFTEISVQDAAAKADAGALLVDVREDDEWDAGHAPDAVHVPLGDLTERRSWRSSTSSAATVS